MSKKRSGWRHVEGGGATAAVAAALRDVRQTTARVYRAGHEQYVAYTWAGGSPGRWTETADPYAVRRYTRDLAVLAVGFTGLSVRRSPRGDGRVDREVLTVLAPIRWATAESRFVAADPVVRTLSVRESDAARDRIAFDLPRESAWAAAASFLARQLMAIVAAPGRPEQYPQVVGPAAVRAPAVVVEIPQEMTSDAAPQPPAYVPLADLGEDVRPALRPDGTTAADRLVFDTDRWGAAIDVRAAAAGARTLPVIHGAAPWFVLPGHIRAVHNVLADVTVRWAVR